MDSISSTIFILNDVSPYTSHLIVVKPFFETWPHCIQRYIMLEHSEDAWLFRVYWQQGGSKKRSGVQLP